MGVMVLHPDQRQSGPLCHGGGVVPGMQVADRRLRFRLQEGLEPPDRLLQRRHRAHIRQIPHIGGGIEQIAHADTERVFQFTPDGQDLSGKVPADHHRKGCISPGTPDHVGPSPVEIHHRIVRTDADLSVVGKHHIAEPQDLRFHIPVLPADGCAGDVSAGHHQAVRHLQVIPAVKQQQLDRGIGKHDPHLGVVRGNGRGQLSRSGFLQQQYGLLMSGQDLLLFRCDKAFPPHRLRIPEHHGKGLHGSGLELSEPGDRLLIGGVTAQMKSADALYGGNLPVQDRLPRHTDGVLAPFAPSHQIDLGSAVRAAHRLGVIPPGRRIVVLPGTLRAHGKFLHGGAFPVIGKRVQDRQSRTAAGTVDKGMQIPPVFPVVHLTDAVVAYGNVRRHEDLAPGLSAFHNGKIGIVRHILQGHIVDLQNGGPFGRLMLQKAAEPVRLFPGPLDEDLHIGAEIADGSADAGGGCVAGDRGPEAHALNDAVHPEPAGDGHETTCFPDTAKCGISRNSPRNAGIIGRIVSSARMRS